MAPTELYALNYLSRRSLGVGGSTLQLLSHFLKLLTDYQSVEAIDGDVKPITFFAFHHEICQRISCVWPLASVRWIVACLRDHVDQQTPRPRLCELGERPRNCLSPFFVVKRSTGWNHAGQARDIS